jgi:hypothetical protein
VILIEERNLGAWRGARVGGGALQDLGRHQHDLVVDLAAQLAGHLYIFEDFLALFLEVYFKKIFCILKVFLKA